MKWVASWKVKSSDGLADYSVSIADDLTTFGCSCPRWTFRRNICRHIKQIKADIDCGIIDLNEICYRMRQKETLAKIKADQVYSNEIEKAEKSGFDKLREGALWKI